ncbi:uncharacterized protein LOC117180821 [Belonocnema kinseyi]|uniref:uncharacterized protein LOC117180821 n=1 Tax=Belonocnema kinseyi TaxID=2817044 RepID=UPI00143CEA17|nr:uncharacterized protein LOC117180821 [Belonocnema kinseyi]
MNRKQSTNSVFPYLYEQVELKPIISGTHGASYDRRVKITDWQDRYLIEPRDKTDFFPPKGNLRMATYNRLGTYEPQKYLTETKENIRKYEPSDFEKHPAPVKMLNIFSYPLTDTDDKSKVNTEIKISRSPENVPEIIEELPNTLYRRTLGYTLEDLEKLEGTRTFLDEDLELHKKIADIKIKQYDR